MLRIATFSLPPERSANNTMQALTLPAARGWHWLSDGFRIFRRNHLMLTFLVVSYWVLMALVNIIPVIGTVATTLCIPAFSVSLMNACRSSERGTPLGPQLLFSGFSSNLRSLLILGAVYLAVTVAILAVSALADDGALMAMMLAGQKPGEEAVSGGALLLATQIALLLLCPLIMAYWYAPVLAGWHGFSPGKALFFSFVACLRNWRAFLVYSVAVVVFATLVPALALGVLAALLTVLVTALIILVLAPTLFASFYASYRDVFVTVEDDD
jgi:hypothetical protein